MNIAEKNKEISKLEDKSWDLEALINSVNSKTKEIKYNDAPSEIYMAVQRRHGCVSGNFLYRICYRIASGCQRC